MKYFELFVAIGDLVGIGIIASLLIIHVLDDSLIKVGIDIVVILCLCVWPIVYYNLLMKR
jgi:hypothetical protein